jgi:hypothetical protein
LGWVTESSFERGNLPQGRGRKVAFEATLHCANGDPAGDRISR